MSNPVQLILRFSEILALGLSLVLCGCGSTTYQDSKEVIVTSGDSIPNNFGPSVDLHKIGENFIILNSDWKIPAEPGSHHVGNHNYLEVLEVDDQRKWIRAKIRSRVSTSAGDAWTF